MNVISKLPQYKEELERTAAIKSWVIDHIRSRKDLEQSEIDANIAYFKGILILPDSLPCYEYIADTSKPDEQRLGFFMGYFDDALKSGTVVHERADEREKFEKLLDRITTASNDKIRKEDLFHEFARAHFTGNYLPLARTVEGVLGQGTFRQIAIELGEMKKKSK